MWFAQVWFIAAASDGDPAFGLAEQVGRAALWQGWLDQKAVPAASAAHALFK